MFIVLKRHYPDFEALLNSIPDHRERHTFQVAEVIMAGLAMFIFKRGSRNHTDKMVTGYCEANYVKLFGCRLPVMDTVDKFLRGLSPDELEKLKQVLVRRLIEKKVLEKWKYQNRYVVAIDGTGVFSFDHEPFEGCPYKESKNGKKTWQAHVVEAKLLCGNGLSISIATQWLNNSEDISNKQDCELKAFVRLAEKVKKMYPRLPVIITADSLYPNDTVFTLCKKNNWDFILTFKEGTLKSVWQEVGLLYSILEVSNKEERILAKTEEGWLRENIMYINEITYKKHTLHWIEYQSGIKADTPDARFVHITNILPDRKSAWHISKHGRLRWKIENEGFNTQKNGGYNLQHKYSRSHFGAMQNYYQLLQIAHLINQLTEKLRQVKNALAQAGTTLKAVFEDVMATMRKELLCEIGLQLELQNCKQLRY